MDKEYFIRLIRSKINEMRGTIKPDVKINVERKTSGGEEFILITSDECAACDFAKDVLKEEISEGVVRVVSIERDIEASELLDKLGVNVIPQLVVKTKSGLYCQMGREGKKIKCAN